MLDVANNNANTFKGLSNFYNFILLFFDFIP